jgi:hypothetical protein
MDPLAGVGTTYMPSTASLPQISSNNSMLMMPFMQDYLNRVDMMDEYRDLMSTRTGVSATAPGGVTNPGGIDYDAYYQRMAENQARMSAYNMQQAMRYRQESLVNSAPMERIKNAVTILQEKVVQDEQTHVQGAFANLIEAVRDAYDPDNTADDETIKIRALTLYQQQTGRSLTEDLRENGRSDMLQGFLDGLGLGLFGTGRTAEDNIAEITDQPASTKAKEYQAAGEVAGFTTTGAGIGAAIGACFGGIGAGPGALVGAGVGAVVGFIKNLF